MSGLTPGTSYTFTVTASNPLGQGPESAPSSAVVPTAPNAPSAPQNVTASPASAQAVVTWAPPASNGGSTITGYTVTPYVGSTAGTPVQVGASATSATLTGLTNGTSYTFQVTATNSVGTGAAGTSPAVTPADTIFDFAAPAVFDSGDTSPVELGVKFTSDAAGSIIGIRFYKAAANTGTHVVGLWTTSGTLLAQANSSNETASGWQQVMLLEPGVDQRRHDVRRRLFRAVRPLLRDVRWVRVLRCEQPPAACAREQHKPERRVRVRIDEHIPVEQLQRKQLLGRRDVHSAGGKRPERAAGRERSRGDRPGPGVVVAAGEQRRQHDHRLHRDAVRRFDGGNPGTGRRVGIDGDGDGVDERDELHIPGHRDEREWHEPRGDNQRGDATRHDSRFRGACGGRFR